MMRIDLFRRTADYNAWMNAKVYDAAATLSPEQIAQERGAFFGSILGTLNHIVVGDTIWMQRFAGLGLGRALEPLAAIEAPRTLRDLVFPDLDGLRGRREALDAMITAWIGELGESDLDGVLAYRRINGEAERKPLAPLLLHFFNHQTHHRGQASTLLMQAGVDIGVTDLLVRIANVEPEP
ncbi:MAG: DinB family protein [Siculibacillus sp.]